MLFLVGLGLSEKDITLGAIDACKACELYVDRFTSKINDNTITRITELTGKGVKEISRQEMEEGSANIIKAAAARDIAILVGGDPLVATTHKILYIAAKKQDVGVKIIHSNSIITTSMGESGLDFYRFGSICTIPRWSSHYSPVSFYEKIHANIKCNCHTIALLDYDQKNESTMEVKEAMDILEKAEMHYKKGIITNNTKIILLHNMSSEGARVIKTTIRDKESADIGGMNVFIIPAELTAIEVEAVEAKTGTKW